MNGSNIPLAERIRPQSLNEFYGQEHLVGKNGIIRNMISTDQLISMLFWGPPGVGKTTLARIIANTTKSYFLSRSAVSTTLNDVRNIVKKAAERQTAYAQKTIFFLDEIHRFNKAQQDSFLPYVENGTIVLIGATTENPSFEVIGPLLSRCRVFVLNPLSDTDLAKIINRALINMRYKIGKKALTFLIDSSNSDARIAINAIETSISLNRSSKTVITLSLLQDVFQHHPLFYDRAGEEHYNTISSYIKSMRASNVDAALYYLARMIEAGEDPLFIARRMVVFASEDVASPTALVVANSVFQACQQIGFPECQENLAAGTVYLTQAKKDRSAYEAYMKALADVKQFGNLPIPLQIRNPVTKLMKDIGYGKGYEQYTKEDLLPEKLKGKKYYVK